MSENNSLGNSQIIDYLKNLDSRVSKIENQLNIYSSNEIHKDEKSIPSEESLQPKLIELNIGEYWFANMGIIILSFGFILLLTLSYENFASYLPSAGGLAITSVFFLMANYIKENFNLISRQLFASGFALLYVSILRLFHFTPEPLFSSQILETILLICVSCAGLYTAYLRDSKYLTGLNLAFLVLTGLIINSPFLFYALFITVSATFAYRFIKNDSSRFILFGIGFVYLAMISWSLNNPIITGMLEIGSNYQVNILTVLVIGTIFSLTNIFHKYETDNSDPSVVISLINGIFCFAIVILNLVGNRSADLIIYLSLVFFLYITIAAAHWRYGSENYSKAIYALIGFASLSGGIIFVSGMPDTYIYLIWQSLVVICTAILFKSKNIIVANFIIFLIIFVAYLATVTSFSIIGLSFGIVALISARLLNWQKHRLTLKTELMRNTYLIVAFFSIPITLIKSLPHEFVGLSLLGVTILYYVFSVVLKNHKYRWMAHFSLLFAIIYSTIDGLTTFNSTWTVVTFLALGIVLISISLIFTKNKVKNNWR